jgi:cell division protein FtsQ
MDHIVVQGCERYSVQEVMEASGLHTGSNLYFLNKFDIKEEIFSKLPYVEEVRINRKLPDTLLVEVRECKAAAGVNDASGIWLISDQGKLLEKTDALPEDCPLITGVTLQDPAPSTQLNAGKETAYRVGVVLTLLRESASRRMRGNIGEIDMGDETALSFTYLGRFTVRFPWTADVDYKLESLSTVVDYLENNETGRIDLMTEGKASFIPGG